MSNFKSLVTTMTYAYNAMEQEDVPGVLPDLPMAYPHDLKLFELALAYCQYGPQHMWRRVSATPELKAAFAALDEELIKIM